ncbi:MAG: hypothetical protein KDB94_13960, partial [Acidobacteria bacterium]|nr:hypothetical protein [Acidobacteriota bacterium]
MATEAGGSRQAEREAVLAALGMTPAIHDELLGYGDNPYLDLELPAEFPPLPPEPQVEAWRGYVAEAELEGAAAALSRRLPQLRFPVAEGVSQSPEYRAATRRGDFDRAAPRVEGPLDEAPGKLELRLHASPAGPVPVLVARRRVDFVHLVRAFTCRNEPEPVPDSMGACLIKGLADWGRVDAYREAWERRRGAPGDEIAWSEEMARMAQRKELWQDRLILVSTGPYSAVPASEAGIEEGEWRERSVALRLAHECFHYLTLRLAGKIRSNLLDELIADYAGLVEAFGGYREELARRFLGVDRLPQLRPGGRLEVYRGDPPL